MSDKSTTKKPKAFTRRELLWCMTSGIALGLGGHQLLRFVSRRQADVFIAKAADYSLDLGKLITLGLQELGVNMQEVHGKRILLKPNLVEVSTGHIHVNTHPLVIRGAIEAFLRLGAAEVLVGEAPANETDTFWVVEGSGLGDVLFEDKIRFVDLNYDNLFDLPNRTGFNSLPKLTFPATLKQVDWVVSIAKMKTHHWAGVTLSMKNLFGVLPGSVYGWPKNVLHFQGISQSIVDINTTLRPHFAIVDGITGMQGDGPIMGDPVHPGVLVMGRDFPSVDATCCRIMGINPDKVDYLRVSQNTIGPIGAEAIRQRGETTAEVFCPFALRSDIPALRLLI